MMYLPMKRSNESELDSAISNMANCLMLLSRGTTSNESSSSYDNLPSRVFECKTCNRQFPSFQALGGHRASHKKPRLNPTDGDTTNGTNSVPTKPKTHECSICGLEFAIGQALGGHMRRHRAVATTNEKKSPPSTDFSNSVVKNVNSRRVFSLDLNLTPLENALEFRLGKVVPNTVELFI